MEYLLGVSYINFSIMLTQTGKSKCWAVYKDEHLFDKLINYNFFIHNYVTWKLHRSTSDCNQY